MRTGWACNSSKPSQAEEVKSVPLALLSFIPGVKPGDDEERGETVANIDRPQVKGQSMWYEIVLKPDDNGTWLVTAPAFPEVVSFGEAQEDPCRNARNAIEEAIAHRIAHGEDIPAPLDCKREHVDRLFRLEHKSRLDSLEDAFKALGHPLRFDMKFPNAA